MEIGDRRKQAFLNLGKGPDGSRGKMVELIAREEKGLQVWVYVCDLRLPTRDTFASSYKLHR